MVLDSAMSYQISVATIVTWFDHGAKYKSKTAASHTVSLAILNRSHLDVVSTMEFLHTMDGVSSSTAHRYNTAPHQE